MATERARDRDRAAKIVTNNWRLRRRLPRITAHARDLGLILHLTVSGLAYVYSVCGGIPIDDYQVARANAKDDRVLKVLDVAAQVEVARQALAAADRKLQAVLKEMA